MFPRCLALFTMRQPCLCLRKAALLSKVIRSLHCIFEHSLNLGFCLAAIGSWGLSLPVVSADRSLLLSYLHVFLWSIVSSKRYLYP